MQKSIEKGFASLKTCAFEIAQELDIGPVFLNQKVKKKTENENRKRECLVTMQIYIVQLLRKRFKANFLKQLVDQAIMSILESFKLTCDVASVFALLFTPSSFVHEQPLSAI